MGVYGLQSFVLGSVPNGTATVNIRNEIRKYGGTPTIVVYSRALFEPLNVADLEGVLCGGRYELAYQILDRFLGRLTQLGAKLVVFGSGPTVDIRQERNRNRDEEDVAEEHHHYGGLVDMVDDGADLRTIVSSVRVPHNNHFPVKLLAKRHGQFRIPARAGDCKKDMLAYANEVNALAIITNNSDFLLFEGPWKFWSSKYIDFERLTTLEFNRTALRQHLGLETMEQVALFGAVGSTNSFLQRSISKQEMISAASSKSVPSLAKFVRQPHEDVVFDLFGPAANEGDLRERFQKKLDYYGTQSPLSESLDLDYFKEQLFWKMWTGSQIDVRDINTDLRDEGPSYLTLSVQILLRIAAVIVFHRQTERTSQDIYLMSRSGLIDVTHPLIFPRQVGPPTLEELFSEDPTICANLATTKLQLYCWIISDTLDHKQLARIPSKLAPTVATIYLLREAQLIELFEADLLLQVAYEITFHKYDMFRIRYPQRLNPRAFRVARFYAAICRYTTKALMAVGLDTREYPGYPLFDGVLFQTLYRKWSHGQGELEPIEQWRIYAEGF